MLAKYFDGIRPHPLVRRISWSNSFDRAAAPCTRSRRRFAGKDSQSPVGRFLTPCRPAPSGFKTAALRPSSLKSHGHIGAQREFELKDDPVRVAACGGRRRRSLTSNSLCACRRLCDLRTTPLVPRLKCIEAKHAIHQPLPKSAALTPAAARPPHRPRRSLSRRSTRRPGSWSRPACAPDRNM
jgi:hypothetical protein